MRLNTPLSGTFLLRSLLLGHCYRRCVSSRGSGLCNASFTEERRGMFGLHLFQFPLALRAYTSVKLTLALPFFELAGIWSSNFISLVSATVSRTQRCPQFTCSQRSLTRHLVGHVRVKLARSARLSARVCTSSQCLSPHCLELERRFQLGLCQSQPRSRGLVRCARRGGKLSKSRWSCTSSRTSALIRTSTSHAVPKHALTRSAETLHAATLHSTRRRSELQAHLTHPSALSSLLGRRNDALCRARSAL